MKKTLWLWIKAFFYPLPWMMTFINVIGFKLTRNLIAKHVSDFTEQPTTIVSILASLDATLSLMWAVVLLVYPIVYLYYLIVFWRNNKPMLVCWILHGLIGLCLQTEWAIRHENFFLEDS